MRKQINWGYAAAFSVVLMFSGINSSIAAQNCVEGGDGQNHSAMRAMVDIKLSGAIKRTTRLLVIHLCERVDEVVSRSVGLTHKSMLMQHTVKAAAL